MFGVNYIFDPIDESIADYNSDGTPRNKNSWKKRIDKRYIVRIDEHGEVELTYILGQDWVNSEYRCALINDEC